MDSKRRPAPRHRAGTGRLVFQVGLLLAATAAIAATPIPRSLAELAGDAEVIVVGTVAGQESRFDDRGTAILTDTTVAVEQTLAGRAGSTLVVTEYGGVVDGVGMVAPGMPSYRPGERVMVFACRDALGLLRTCGAGQGKLALRAGGAGGAGDAEVAVGRMGGETIRQPLDTLRQRIAAARGGASSAEGPPPARPGRREVSR